LPGEAALGIRSDPAHQRDLRGAKLTLKQGTAIFKAHERRARRKYRGMVEILSETPEVHVTFNLVPSLLDQIEAYVSGDAREAELRLGLAPADRLDESEKVYLLRAAFMAHPENLIGRLPRFAELHALRGPRNDEASLRAVVPRFGPAEMRDLQVLSKLAWFDLEWQREDPALRALIVKGRDYTEDDKRVLADRERALLAAVIPAYRRAADEGRVELSASPITTRSFPCSATATCTARRTPAPTCPAASGTPRTRRTRFAGPSSATPRSSAVPPLACGRRRGRCRRRR